MAIAAGSSTAALANLSEGSTAGGKKTPTEPRKRKTLVIPKITGFDDDKDSDEGKVVAKDRRSFEEIINYFYQPGKESDTTLLKPDSRLIDGKHEKLWQQKKKKRHSSAVRKAKDIF